MFLREVLIYANDQPIIYARTVFKKNLRQLSGLVKKLNENPLANIVFKKKTKRSEFIFSHMSPNYKLSKRLNEILFTPDELPPPPKGGYNIIMIDYLMPEHSNAIIQLNPKENFTIKSSFR